MLFLASRRSHEKIISPDFGAIHIESHKTEKASEQGSALLTIEYEPEERKRVTDSAINIKTTEVYHFCMKNNTLTRFYDVTESKNYNIFYTLKNVPTSYLRTLKEYLENTGFSTAPGKNQSLESFLLSVLVEAISKMDADTREAKDKGAEFLKFADCFFHPIGLDASFYQWCLYYVCITMSPWLFVMCDVGLRFYQIMVDGGGIIEKIVPGKAVVAIMAHLMILLCIQKGRGFSRFPHTMKDALQANVFSLSTNIAFHVVF